VPNKSCEVNILVKAVDFAAKEYAYKKKLDLQGVRPPRGIILRRRSSHAGREKSMLMK
jgi:hypothetical protein